MNNQKNNLIKNPYSSFNPIIGQFEKNYAGFKDLAYKRDQHTLKDALITSKRINEDLIKIKKKLPSLLKIGHNDLSIHFCKYKVETVKSEISKIKTTLDKFINSTEERFFKFLGWGVGGFWASYFILPVLILSLEIFFEEDFGMSSPPPEVPRFLQGSRALVPYIQQGLLNQIVTLSFLPVFAKNLMKYIIQVILGTAFYMNVPNVLKKIINEGPVATPQNCFTSLLIVLYAIGQADLVNNIFGKNSDLDLTGKIFHLHVHLYDAGMLFLIYYIIGSALIQKITTYINCEKSSHTWKRENRSM